MNSSMYWLTCTIFMTVLMWIPYIINLFMQRGLITTLSNVNPEDPNNLSPWARRAKAAHYNAVENLVLFAPLVIMAHVLKLNTVTLVSSVKIYFWARLFHYAFYTLGIPYARTVTFLVAWGATLAILVQVFKVV